MQTQMEMQMEMLCMQEVERSAGTAGERALEGGRGRREGGSALGAACANQAEHARDLEVDRRLVDGARAGLVVQRLAPGRCKWKLLSTLRPRRASKLLRPRSGLRRSGLSRPVVQGGRRGAVLAQGSERFQPAVALSRDEAALKVGRHLGR